MFIMSLLKVVDRKPALKDALFYPIFMFATSFLLNYH